MPPARSPWVAWCLALLLAAGCQPGQIIPGKYLAGGPGKPDSQVVLALHPTGKGSWTYNDEEVSFQWDSKADEVWLHLKGGGLIVGKTTGDGTIKLELPGFGAIVFQRAGP